MDFNLKKENIQPLRGGRNATQLEMALQAPHSQEYQQELMNQRQEFENAIRNYNGNDPLENYCNYIHWIEQTYPKHGPEGNLIPLLESCLGEYERDERYINDRRFCKLWIKYIDTKDNPVEFYKFMYDNKMFRGCADLYRAWAFYYQICNDYVNADQIYKLGKTEVAQPYQDLHAAHESMLIAASGYSITGVVDQDWIHQQRQALTALHVFKSGRVGSVRTAADNHMSALPSVAGGHHSNNIPVQVFANQEDESLGAVARTQSVLSLTKTEAVKENITKPGKWTVKGKKYGAGHAHKTPGFLVAEDTDEPEEQTPVIYPQYKFAKSMEDYSDWNRTVCLHDPDDPTKIPMYCKKHVYIDPTTEYSMEELRARKYLRKKSARLSVPMMETEQAVMSIADNMDSSMHEAPPFEYQQTLVPHQPNEASAVLMDDRQAQAHSPYRHHSLHKENLSEPPTTPDKSPFNMKSFRRFQDSPSFQWPENQAQQTTPPGAPAATYDNFVLPTTPAQNSSHDQDLLSFWNSSSDSVTNNVPNYPEKNHVSKFQVFQESFHEDQIQPQAKGSAMKTPLNEINHEDLAETGSRGGMDAAAMAQPADGAKRLIMNIDEDSTSRFSINNTPPPNTEVFYSNNFHESTPITHQYPKKQLFENNDHPALSVIVEERSNFSSSGSGAHSTKSLSSGNQFKIAPMDAIAEEYQFNLAQNMKKNAALREQLLNSMKDMDCDTQPSTPTLQSAPPHRVFDILDSDEDEDDDDEEIFMQQKHVPYPILPQAPSDPFKESVLEKQLEHVGFPGRHRQGFVVLHTVPRISLKKTELSQVGTERFACDKLIGNGTYGKVYKATRVPPDGRPPVALKVQKRPNKWEYYICREIQSRLGDDLIKEKFMNVHIGYFGDKSSVLVSDFSPYGTLLDLVNVSRKHLGKSLKDKVCQYLAVEMLSIVEALQSIKIIHADIKPDNFLVTLNNNMIGLQLIDFGCSIDMSLYPEGTMFTRKITTDGFVCCEIRDDRPWSYHTDLFCVAATVYSMLFEKYIALKKDSSGIWSITQKFQRYQNTVAWNLFFNTLLNMQAGLPDLKELKDVLSVREKGFDEEMRELVTALRSR